MKITTLVPKLVKPADETTVVVAMSGGVDSSLAAALLVEQGYNCIGVMMRLWAETGPGEGSTNKCCSLESVHDARSVADRLGIPFYLINVEETFKANVVDFFINGYSAGQTPNPCLACNKHIRFDYLLNYARRLGADFLATGHYARLRRLDDGTVHLLRAEDDHKDQSYVLSVMGQAELRDVLFPIGDYPKPEVRKMAAARGLPTASKHDSMDLCFIHDDDYRRFLQDWATDAMRPGPIVDRRGRVLGEHQGLPSYTIGQRKGLGLSGTGEPIFVLELDSARNALVVGTVDELGRNQLVAHGVNWTLDAPVADGTVAQCKIRYRAQPAACTLHPLDDNTVEVRFAEALRGVTPGQGAIFYDGDLCLGGRYHRIMLAYVPPALLLSVLLSVAYAGLLHLWKGRSLRDLLLYLVASALGFAVGQLLGILLQIPLPHIGQIHVVEASIFAWAALIGVRELTMARRIIP